MTARSQHCTRERLEACGLLACAVFAAEVALAAGAANASLESVKTFGFVAVLLTLATSTLGCLLASDEEVVLPTAAVVPPAPPAPGLADGCNDSGRTVGRLLGRFYTLPLETRRLPDFSVLPSAGSVCLSELDVSERSGYPSFPGVRNRYTWFGVDLQGAFVVAQDGVYDFRLTSDDGSKLLIDGAQVIDDDGYHQTRTVVGSVDLPAGTHVIDVPYWQGPGPLSLVLEVARHGGPFEVFHLDRPLPDIGYSRARGGS